MWPTRRRHVANQEAGKTPSTAMEAGAPPGRDDKEMATPVATQQAGKEPPTAVEAGAPPG
jgi:hypothetical protein